MVQDYIGPTRCNALDAGATAIVAGVEYMLSHQDVQGLQIFFNYDAVAVGHGACGKQRTPQTQEVFSARQHAARVLMSIRQQKSHSMTGLHVKAQEGQPWNECAESIAAWGKLLQNPLRDWPGLKLVAMKNFQNFTGSWRMSGLGLHDSLLDPASVFDGSSRQAR